MTKPLLKLTGIALAAAAVPCALAGPLDRAWVAKDASWVVHVDVEAGLGSTLGRFALANRGELHLENLDRVKAETGIDPMADIKGVTVYGITTDPRDGVAVIFTTPAVDGLTEKLKDKAMSFEILKEGPYTIYTWKEHGEGRFGLIRPGPNENDRIVLVAADKGRLLEGAKLGDGKAPALEKGAPGLLGQSPKPGSIMFAAANDISCAEAMPFEKAKGLLLDMGEAEGQMYADLTVVPTEPGDANDLLGILQGSMAFVRMAAKSDPETAGLAKLAEGISFASQDGQVKAHVQVKSDELIRVLGTLKAAAGGKPGPGKKHPAPAGKPANNQPDGGDKH